MKKVCLVKIKAVIIMLLFVSVHAFSQSKNHHKSFKTAKTYINANKADSAFIYFKKALKEYTNNNMSEQIAETNLEICTLLRSQKKLNVNKNIYFNHLYSYAKESNSKKWLAECYNILGKENFKDKNSNIPKTHFLTSYKLHKELKNNQAQIDLLSNLGVLYHHKIKKIDSARYFFNKALTLFEQDSLAQLKINSKFNIYNNIGNTFKTEKKYNRAIHYFKNAERLNINEFAPKSRKILYANLQKSYYAINDKNNAYLYLKKYDSIKEGINLTKQNGLISEALEKYDNEKLRADNLEIESKRIKIQNYLIIALVIILFGSASTYFIQKNAKRKQKLAEQEKALETQKLTTVLKDQELNAIDAMIAGQEKERQRIANDLHDDLGGLMANVKLHFNALKEDNSDELFTKTNTLIDEAYQKVRTVAHAKNSGVIANQGLLKAIKEMANKISASNKIAIEIVEHGLNGRLENSLELTLFRIIQELIANVIKHAEATEAIIHLTNYDDSLNIMVEDNGKGFSTSQITTKNKGMGISSIDKRVEHLNGTMNIESAEQKGTTVIIDIPL